MNKLFYKAASLIKNIPLKYLVRATDKRIIFPFYHSVSDVEVPHLKHLYKAKTISCFEKDLDFLLNNYTPIDIHTYYKKLENNEPIEENSFLLTFDDGLSEFYDTIAPILNRKGIPATCFLNSQFIDNKDLFYRCKESLLVDKLETSSEVVLNELTDWFLEKGIIRNNLKESILNISYSQKEFLSELAVILELDFNYYLENQRPYLTSVQVEELITQGYSFGAHSIDHPPFSELNLQEQIRQIKQSVEEITTAFKLDYKLFSFPFTDYGVSKEFFDVIFQKDNAIADISFGTAGLKKDTCKKNIQRIPFEIANFTSQEIVYGEYLYYLLKAMLHKNTIRRH